MRPVLFFMSLLLLTALAACKSTRKLSETPVATDYRPVRPDADRFDHILSNTGEYESFSSRVSVNFKIGSRSFSSSGSIKIVRDQIFWLSAQLLGFEVFRVMITGDSLFVMNKINQLYAAESLEKYKAKLPVDVSLSAVESLFLNRLFIPGEKPVGPDDLKRFEYRESPSGMLEMAPRKKHSVQSAFVVNPDDRIAQACVTALQQQMSLTWIYQRFTKQDDVSFPVRAEITLAKEGDVSWAQGTITYSRPEWNRVTSVNTKIPDRYTQVPLESMLKSLKIN